MDKNNIDQMYKYMDRVIVNVCMNNYVKLQGKIHKEIKSEQKNS